MIRHLFAAGCLLALVGSAFMCAALHNTYGRVPEPFLFVAGAPLVGLAWYLDDLNDRAAAKAARSC